MGASGGANSNDHIFELRVLNCGGPKNPNEADIIPVLKQGFWMLVFCVSSSKNLFVGQFHYTDAD